MAVSKEMLKRLLIRVEEESEKDGLKLNIQKPRAWHLVPSLHGNKKVGKVQKKWLILCFWAPKSLQTVTAAMKLNDTCSLDGEL